LPDVGFSITHLGDTPFVRAKIKLDVYVNGKLSSDTLSDSGARYNGITSWNLNPREGVDGHFSICNAACQDKTDVRVGINIVVYDFYDRPHRLLPVTYVYERKDNEWWLDPIDPDESAKEALGGA
jgi:hypothetical protein